MAGWLLNLDPSAGVKTSRVNTYTRPRAHVWVPVGFIAVASLALTVVPAEPLPFASGEWRVPTSVSTWRTPQTVSRSSGDPAPPPAAAPFAQTEWPNPRAAVFPTSRLTFIGYIVDSGAAPAPFTGIADPLPTVRPRAPLPGFTAHTPLAATTAPPFRGSALDVARRGPIGVGFAASVPTALANVPVAAAPFKGSALEVSRQRVQLAVGFTVPVPTALANVPAAAPFKGIVSDVTRRTAVQNVGASFGTPRALVTARPFTTTTDPLPRKATRILTGSVDGTPQPLVPIPVFNVAWAKDANKLTDFSGADR